MKMSKKFYAVHRETGERWKPCKDSSTEHEYIVMYDTGYFAVVKDYGWDGLTIQALDTKVWKVIWKDKDEWLRG